MKRIVIWGGIFLGLFFLSACYETSTYKIEKKRYVITNDNRAEVLTDDPDDVRTFAVTVFYPSDSEKGLISESEENYPVMLFSSGGGMTIDYYTELIEGLVNKGIVVAALEHPYCDKLVKINGNRYKISRKQIKSMGEPDFVFRVMSEVEACDAKDAIDLLEEKNISDFIGKLDLDRIAYTGHSLGAMASTLSIADGSEFSDPRIKAAISYDGNCLYDNHPDIYLYGLARPFFYVATDDFWGDDRDISEVAPSLTVYPLFDAVPAGNIIEIEGTGHHSMTRICDAKLMTSTGLTSCGDGSTDTDQAHTIFLEYTYAFLMEYLNGESQPMLDGPSPMYPEVDMVLVK